MRLREAIESFRDPQKNSMRDKTRESHGHLFQNLEALFSDAVLENISSQDLYQFLLLLTEGRARSTARLRHTQIRHSLISSLREGTHLPIASPCNDNLLSKTGDLTGKRAR